MKNKYPKAFTLVELIVVITIIAILGTIAFISLQGYSRSARNSKRISDISNIKTSLALFNTRTGRYPEPDNIINITYTGTTVWSQGEVGEAVTRNLKELGKTPLDPLLEKGYVYSLLNTKKEYEIGGIFEGAPLTYNNELLSKTNAATKSYYAYIKGDYNGKVAKLTIANKLYVFAIPSIIGADLSNQDILELIKNKSLVYDGYQNIPSNYEGLNITMTGSFDFGGDLMNTLVYSGTLDDLSTNYASLETLGTNLQKVYSGTILSNNSEYTSIININTSDASNLRTVAGGIVKNDLGGEIPPVIFCGVKPNFTHTNFISGLILVDGTPWQNTNPSNSCYYECTDGYTGNDCSIGPSCATEPNYPHANFIQGTVIINGTSWQNSNSGAACYYECKDYYTGNDCSIPPSCATQPNYPHANFTTGNPTLPNVSRQYSIPGNPCYYVCKDGYTGTTCNIPPLTGWRAVDPNCLVEDRVVGTQTWAGCNSTIGTGIEFLGGYNCGNYNGGYIASSATCHAGSLGDSTDTELAYFESIYGVGGSTPTGDKGVNNIWGKQYTWVNATTACTSGRYLPTDAEWLTLKNYLIANNGGSTAIGWKGHTAKSTTNNVVNALLLPLGGYIGQIRGLRSNRWTSTQTDTTNAKFREVNSGQNRLYQFSGAKTDTLPVRCIKR